MNYQECIFFILDIDNNDPNEATMVTRISNRKTKTP